MHLEWRSIINSRPSLSLLTRFCLLTLVIISQGRSQSPLGGSELIIEVADNTNHQTVTIEVRALGQVWDASFDKGEYPGDTISTDVDHPMLDFDHVTSINSDNPIIGFGLYEVTIKVAGTPQISFRADFTDCLYPYGGGRWADLWFEYYHATGLLYETIIYNPPAEIGENETVHIWDNGNGLSGSPSTSCFQPTDPSNLSISSSGGHPYLSWTASEPASATYHVYRSNTGSGGWTQLTSSPITPTTWLDEHVVMQSGSKKYYRVRALSGDGTKWSADYSNMDSCTGVYQEERRAAENLSRTTVPKGLRCVSYPNPFNPSTTVNYDVPASGHVHLLIYDILGREVARLVDRDLDAGTYEAVWAGTDQSGSAMPSGVYYATLLTLDALGRADRGSTNKLILMK